MTLGSSSRLAPSTATARRGLRKSWRRSRRGVSEVVATIILLALTVTLFSAIFAFVSSFPPPPAQNSNQFQATLSYAANATDHNAVAISGVNILHLAGPAVPSSALVYIKSSTNPQGPQFKNAYTMAAGGISGNTWNLGQTWIGSFSVLDPIGDNLTIYVVVSSQLIFSVTLPGQSFTLPPTFVAISVTPGTPTVGSTFNVTATLAGTVTPYSVYITLAGIPGLTNSPVKMTLRASTGTYYLLVTSTYGTTTANGTYYAFLNASNSLNQAGSTAFAITFVSPTGTSLPLASGGPTGLTTSTVTIMTYTPGATELLQLSWTLSCVTGSTTPTLKVTYTDPHAGAQTITLYNTAMATGATVSGTYNLVSTASAITVTASENTGSNRLFATVAINYP
jgi:flagellin-like protein